jgi:hypothetical protein
MKKAVHRGQNSGSVEQSQVALGIDYFGRGHWLTAIQARVSYRARRRMFLVFKNFAGQIDGMTLLDVGATPDLERLDSNCMIPWFDESGMRVALYSPEDIQHLKDVFKSVTIIPASGFGKPIPADDRSYDWVSSAAVLEHVGSRDKQRDFIRDSARVGNGLFITTPNRLHWLEFHTKLPLIHWLPANLHRKLLRRLGLELWAKEEHLNLLTRRELMAMASATLGDDFNWCVKTVWALGMPSNLILLARRKIRSISSRT